MSLKTKSMQFLMISIILHVVLILWFVNGKMSTNKPDTKKNKINSYITFKQKPLPQLITKPAEPVIDGANETAKDYPKPLTLTEINSDIPIVKKDIVDFTAVTEPKKALIESVATTSKPLQKIQSSTSQYIEKVNSMALDNLSNTSLYDQKKSKPINIKSSSSTYKQIQKTFEESFTLSKVDISVVSETVDEILILHGDSCYKVKETALDDRVYRGASAWIRSSECGDIDEFNGQLQISLDKYLKN